MADPSAFWSAIFMFCLENGRWQTALSSPVSVYCMHSLFSYATHDMISRTANSGLSEIRTQGSLPLYKGHRAVYVPLYKGHRAVYLSTKDTA